MKIRICINGKKLRKIISHINLISHLVFYLMVHKIYICRLGVDFHSLSLHFNIHLYLPLSFLSFFLLRRFFLFFIFSSFSCMFVFMPLFYSLKRGLRSLSPNIYSCQGRILISFILLLYTWYIPMHLLKECVSSKNEKTLVFYF